MVRKDVVEAIEEGLKDTPLTILTKVGHEVGPKIMTRCSSPLTESASPDINYATQVFTKETGERHDPGVMALMVQLYIPSPESLPNSPSTSANALTTSSPPSSPCTTQQPLSTL
ncbi:hypothetical protein JAAARDRAFT_344326 [Jaapia argillacea MUCL 33604]|uniref:Uncharacterized protein n=1 Tax=Jaapia argillacea MUCL 33604 TaxID=933084 RepID=A0A067PXX4_9AGAM|nr:hypothetical protein JAAARDRAFT_344326 [Jaapia argillacea MUCL 33604]